MNAIPYNDLEKHFSEPKWLREGKHFTIKRLPRKKKKAVKKQMSTCIYRLDITTFLWYSLEPNYKRFLIKCIVK